MKNFIKVFTMVILLIVIFLSMPVTFFAENDKSVSESKKSNIESVEIVDNTVIITLSKVFKNFDFSDISIGAYTDNWYDLEPVIDKKLNISEKSAEITDDGKTVIKLKVLDEIKDGRLVRKPVEENFESISQEIKVANNYVSWQMDNGGWDKAYGELHKIRPWNGVEPKNIHSGWSTPTGEPIGTIDNSATYSHIIQIAKVYQKTKNPVYKKSIEKGLDFLFELQYPSGGFAQVYPARGNYSDYVTFNDNAMINALRMIQDVSLRKYPFNGDVISDEYVEKAKTSIKEGVDYILKSQIVSKGVLSAWCAQHDPVTYEPRGGRAYELPSISGSESIPIIKFLIAQEQTPEIKNAVDSAIKWFKNNYVANTDYERKPADRIPFKEKEGSRIWYRFYDIDTNEPIFSDRDGVPKNNLDEVGTERRFGYTWAGKWAEKLINVMDTVGFYKNKVVVEVVGNHSKATDGETLCVGEIIGSNEADQKCKEQ